MDFCWNRILFFGWSSKILDTVTKFETLEYTVVKFPNGLDGGAVTIFKKNVELSTEIRKDMYSKHKKGSERKGQNVSLHAPVSANTKCTQIKGWHKSTK